MRETELLGKIEDLGREMKQEAASQVAVLLATVTNLEGCQQQLQMKVGGSRRGPCHFFFFFFFFFLVVGVACQVGGCGLSGWWAWFFCFVGVSCYEMFL